MHTPTCSLPPDASRLAPPPPSSHLAAGARGAPAPRTWWATPWQRWRRWREQRRTEQALRLLDERTLRDIGAPQAYVDLARHREAQRELQLQMTRLLGR